MIEFINFLFKFACTFGLIAAGIFFIACIGLATIMAVGWIWGKF